MPRLFGRALAEDHRPCRAAERQQNRGVGLGVEGVINNLVRDAEQAVDAPLLA